MNSEWKSILRIFHLSRVVLGINGPQKWQRRLLYFTFCDIVLYGVCFLWTSLVDADGFLQRIQYAIMSGVIVAVLMFYLSLIKFSYKYMEHVEWCEKLHVRFSQHLEFVVAARQSERHFRMIVMYIPVFGVLLMFFQSLALSVLTRSLRAAIPAHTPFAADKTSSVHQVVMCIVELFGALPVTLLIGMPIGVIVVTIFHFIAVLQFIQKLLAGFFNQTSSRAEFIAKIRCVVDLHCELIAHQQLLTDFMSAIILIFEIMCYCLLLFGWILFFFAPSQMFIAVVASGNVVPYILVCWINEKLQSAHDDLRRVLYDVSWYTMSTWERKNLLQLFMMMSQPRFLTAGPFHVVSFENLLIMMGRIYRCGVLINNFAK